MARAKKTIKKAVKSVAKKAPPAPKLEAKIKKHIEELRLVRRDAATIWDEIQDKDLTDEDLRELLRQHNFGTLLGEVS